ncbi:hypothetical protein [Nesterenkonia halotolerans]|uniref:Uncharacterized protein n=1 Tax=Nesterenkonia halotolerans TaxID=225325 RepID=A0ABR9J2Q2_9MICC|nr:hypothetical protein [Nesterenkonia halotolerans]MBE1513278.1 hypothetical protein [Nesterenkonia halotolerans]
MTRAVDGIWEHGLMRQYLTVVISVIVALAVNVLLDVNTEMPMLLRWLIAVALSMLVTWGLARWTADRARRGSSDSVRAGE